MANQNNRPNQWPKACVASVGTCAISASAYYANQPLIMFGMIILWFIILCFD